MKRRNRQMIAKAIKTMVVIGIAVLMLLSCAWYATHYTREGTVKQVINDDIIIVDEMDVLWLVSNDNDYQIGDKVKIAIYTNTTDLNTDDDIIDSVKKIK